MAKRLQYFFLSICLLLTSLTASAQQDTEKGPVNQFFRSEGKIYVVVGALVIIFIGIVLYLVRLDRRISRLEKE